MPNRLEQRAYFVLAAQSSPAPKGLAHPIHMLGIPDVKPVFMIGNGIAVGQPLLVVLGDGGGETETLAGAVYSLDREHRPFQISGLADMLLDPTSITDATRPYVARLRQGQAVYTAALMELTVEQMLTNETRLRGWEAMGMSRMLGGGVSAVELAEFAWLTWRPCLFNDATNARVRDAVSHAAASDWSAEILPLEVDLRGYPLAAWGRQESQDLAVQG
jgi:hypothetical protein